MAPPSDNISQLLNQIQGLQASLSEFGVSPAVKSGTLLVWPDASCYDTVQRTPDLFTAVAQVGLFAARPEAEFLSGSDGSFRAKATECCFRIMNSLLMTVTNADAAQKMNAQTTSPLNNVIQAITEPPEERDPRLFNGIVQSQVGRVRDALNTSNSRFQDSIDNLYTSLNLSLDLNVMVATNKGTAAQKQKATELKDIISRLIRPQAGMANLNQYGPELQSYSNTAEKRFVEAATRTPDGKNYLGSLIGWKLSSVAALGLPILLQKQSNVRRITKIDVNTAVLQAASTPNQDRINQLTKGKEAVKSRIDKLSDPVLVDGEHIRSLLLIFVKVLVSMNGGPNWDEISQDVSASKSDWAYLRTELTALSKASYGSSTLGVEGRSIVDQANKLADELKTYNDKRTDGRVSQIASEVDALKLRANKLSVAISLQSGKVAVPIQLGDSTGPTTDKPQFASRALQNLAFQSTVIVKQLEASKDLFGTVTQNTRAKAERSRNFFDTLDALRKGTDWNILEGVLLEVVLMLAEKILEFQEFQEFINISIASINAVLSQSLDALGRTLRSGSNESELGDVSQLDYELRTSINHLINLGSVGATLKRFLQSYVEIYRRYGEVGSTQAMQVIQVASIQGPDNEATTKSDRLMVWGRDTVNVLGGINEEQQRRFEDDVQDLSETLRDGPKLLESSLSGLVDTAKSEYVSEVGPTLSLV